MAQVAPRAEDVGAGPRPAEAATAAKFRLPRNRASVDSGSLVKERTDVQVSKYDIPATGIPLSADGVVVSRLTRMACSSMLREPGGRPQGFFLCARSRDDDWRI